MSFSAAEQLCVREAHTFVSTKRCEQEREDLLQGPKHLGKGVRSELEQLQSPGIILQL